jgi:hypothetical protein
MGLAMVVIPVQDVSIDDQDPWPWRKSGARGPEFAGIPQIGLAGHTTTQGIEGCSCFRRVALAGLLPYLKREEVFGLSLREADLRMQ